MTDATLLVSVVITTFNQSAFIDRAIESVKANMVHALEVLVVDDGSSENSGADVRSRYDGVRYIRQANQGVSAARNTGAANAMGDWIIFLDADDMLLPTAIGDLGDAALGAPEAAFVIGASERRSAVSRVATSRTEPVTVTSNPYTDILSRDALWHPAQILFNKRCVIEAGGFLLTQGAEDLELVLRLATRHPYQSVPGVVSIYWQHETSMSGNPWRMYRGIAKCFRAHRRDPNFIAGSKKVFRRARALRLDFYSRAILLSGLSEIRRKMNPLHLIRAIAFVAIKRPAVLGWFLRFLFHRTVGTLPMSASAR